MPSVPHPTFEVIAFHAPLVEAGMLRQVVHTDTGLRQLVAPVGIWAKGLASIRKAIAAAPAQIPTRGNLKRGPRSLSPERRALYIAAHRDFLSAKFPSRAACARAHAIGYAAWTMWLSNHREEVAKEIGKLPVTKTGGRLL